MHGWHMLHIAERVIRRVNMMEFTIATVRDPRLDDGGELFTPYERGHRSVNINTV